MKPAPFTYHVPASVSEAVSMLGQLGDEGRVLAGGQSLVPLMNFRLAQPPHLVDIRRLGELDFIRREDGRLAIGARVRQSTLERTAEAAHAVPLLVEATSQVGHPPIRHRGTVCGSVAHADPAAELPTALLALGGEVVLQSSHGERVVPIVDFLTGPFTTALQPGELVREVRATAWSPSAGHAFVEYSRRHGDFAVAGVAALLELASGSVERAAIALCGVAGTPVRAGAAEQLLTGATGTREEVEAAAATAVEGLEPSSDLHGSGDYRRRVARACVVRALERAFRRAHGGGQE